jgi:hypothetical protein
MPTKKIIKQKQKQRQSVTVNVNLAKSRARASAKKSGTKSRGVSRGSVMMLPPPIYTSPVDKLTPSIYGAQGQQIQQRSMEELLKNFLSNQEKQTASLSIPNKLGSAPESGSASLNSLRYFPNQHSDSSLGSFSSDSLNSRTASTSIYSRIPSSSGSSISSSFSPDSLDEDALYRRNRQEYFNKYGKPLPLDLPSYYRDNVSEMTDPSYMSDFTKPMSTESQYDRALASPFSSDIPIPFQNEERSYLRTAEPDYEANIPKFSQNEARVSQGNIYESSRRPDKRPPVKIIDDSSTIDSSTVSSVPNKKRMPVIYDDSSVDTSSILSNPFPERMYNKMMGFS